MGESSDNHIKESLKWILMVSLSPMAFPLFMLLALNILLRFLFKVTLLLIIIAINTPFAVMYKLDVLVSDRAYWNYSDPNYPSDSLGIEVKLIVSNFVNVVATELLLLMSTGIITYFTASRIVFYYSTAIWLVAIFHKWLNTNCYSKTTLSSICDGFGLSPRMFLFSFLGFFDSGCHPIAKCSFSARRAFLFEKDVPNQFNKEVSQDLAHGRNLNHQIFLIEEGPKESIQEEGHSKLNKKDGPKLVLNSSNRLFKMDVGLEVDVEQGDKELNAKENEGYFNRALIDTTQLPIEFLGWNAFGRGLFKLIPRIEFIDISNGKYILKSFMVLKLPYKIICQYPVESLELPEDYSKANELFNFLVTDKMRGRNEHSLTLLQIVEGVQEYARYKIMDPIEKNKDPKDKRFIVA